MKLDKLLAWFLPVFFLTATPVCADEYLVPTETTLLQTLLRFGALDINNDVFIDDYAKILECDLFSVFRDDDFKWNKIREGLRTKIRNESITYPSNYVVKGLISLDRYDFNNKTFKINPNSPLLGVNAFRLMSMNTKYCDAVVKAIPLEYTAAIEARINIPGFIMSESDAQALLDRLNSSGNRSRQIMAKFNIKIIGVSKVKIDTTDLAKWYDKISYVGKKRDIVMEAKLDSVEFFEEPEMKRRIFVYKP